MNKTKEYSFSHFNILHDTYIGYCKYCDLFICSPDNVVDMCGAEIIICPKCQRYFDACDNKKNKLARKKLKRLLAQAGPALINREVQPVLGINSCWSDGYKGVNKRCLNCIHCLNYNIYGTICEKDHEYIVDTEHNIDCPDFKECEENDI